MWAVKWKSEDGTWMLLDWTTSRTKREAHGEWLAYVERTAGNRVSRRKYRGRIVVVRVKVTEVV